MCFCSQFFLCVPGCIKTEVLCTGYQKRTMIGSGQCQSGAVPVASVFLWTQIIFMETVYIRGIKPKFCIVMFVRITFDRSITEISNIGKGRFQKQTQTETRQERHLWQRSFCKRYVNRFSLTVYGNGQSTVFGNFPCNSSLDDPLQIYGRQRIGGSDRYTIFILRPFSSINFCACSVVACSFPFPADPAVVIHRCTPDI